jgi:hypothetical protein
MPEINKQLVRLASALQGDLASRRRQHRLELPNNSWDCCRELMGQIQRAELRGWHLAAEELRRELAYTVPSLQSELEALLSRLPSYTSTTTIASVGDIYADLLALQQGFDELNYDVRGRWFSVTTEPITLQGIYLGPFEIHLDWHRIGDDCAYRVIATDAHPCESRENVTHPHVMDERLCEGDSRQAIRHALAQGRILDFFTLVANGLRSYNSDSPFVALELWYGSTCSDCGCVVDEDDCYTCEKCEERICGNCQSSCADCGEYCCSQCITTCEACDDNYCRSCLRECTECRAQVCSSCFPNLDVNPSEAVGKYLAQPVLRYSVGTRIQPSMLKDFQNGSIITVSVHDERCINCHEKRQDRTEKAGSAADLAAIQPDSVGQTLVPA